MVSSAFTPSIWNVTVEVTLSLQLLVLIYAAVVGNSMIRFEKILRRTKEPIELQAASSATGALRMHVISLTELIIASFALSSLFLILGNIESFKLEPLILVAVAVAILLLSLVFLGTSSPSTSKPKKE
jgi:hypothetical protein